MGFPPHLVNYFWHALSLSHFPDEEVEVQLGKAVKSVAEPGLVPVLSEPQCSSCDPRRLFTFIPLSSRSLLPWTPRLSRCSRCPDHVFLR